MLKIYRFQEGSLSLDERETSRQVVACFIQHSMICPNQITWRLVFESANIACIQYLSLSGRTQYL